MRTFSTLLLFVAATAGAVADPPAKRSAQGSEGRILRASPCLPAPAQRSWVLAQEHRGTGEGPVVSGNRFIPDSTCDEAFWGGTCFAGGPGCKLIIEKLDDGWIMTCE